MSDIDYSAGTLAWRQLPSMNKDDVLLQPDHGQYHLSNSGTFSIESFDITNETQGWQMIQLLVHHLSDLNDGQCSGVRSARSSASASSAYDTAVAHSELRDLYQ